MPAFETDLLDRKNIAERILDTFTHRGTGTIIVDALWGDGKTYFGKNFVELLKEEYKASPVYIDAFESDFVESPFIMLTGSIYEQVGKKAGKKKFLDKSVDVAKKIIPTVLKTAVSCASSGLLNGKVQEKIIGSISDGLSSITGEIAEDIIKNYGEQKKSIEAFKQALENIALEHKESTKSEKYKNGLPLFVFVDELDRCMPTFAVRLLEQLKHLFSVKNVVFILLINKAQLVEYLKGIYGQGVDGEMYLEKFVDISISLTSLPPDQTQSNSYEYASRTGGALLKGDGPSFEEFATAAHSFIRGLSMYNHIPLRVIDKYYFYMNMVDKRISRDFVKYVGILVIIKLMRPLLYDDFLKRKVGVGNEIIELLSDNIKGKNEAGERLKNFINNSIKVFMDRMDIDERERNGPYMDILDTCERERIDPKDAFHRAAQYLDFKIYG